MKYHDEKEPILLDVSGGSDTFRIRWHKANQRAAAEKRGIIIPRGDHVLDDQLTIPDGIPWIRGERDARIFCRGSESKRVSILMRSCYGMTVEGLSFIQESPAANQEAILYAIGGGDLSFKRFVFENVSIGSAIYVAARDAKDLNNILIEDCVGKGPVLSGEKISGPVMFRVEASGDNREPSELWRTTKTSRAFTAWPCNVTFNRCASEGAYYGFGVSGGKGIRILNCLADQSVRGISLQNGVYNCEVAGTTVQDCISAGIHLAYVGDNNHIHHNTVISKKAVGEGLIQAYVGVQNTLIEDNMVIAIEDAKPRWFYYVGPHAHGTVIRNNNAHGHPARAYVAIEEGWPQDTTQKASRSYGHKNAYNWRGFASEAIQRVRVYGNRVGADDSTANLFIGSMAGMTGQQSIRHDFPASAVVRTTHPANLA